MNNEAAPTTSLVVPSQEVVESETIDTATDVSNFERAKKMEDLYIKRYMDAHRTDPTRDVRAEKAKLMDYLYGLTNPATNSPYTSDDLNCIYLYHVVSGDMIAHSPRETLPPVMEYDLKDSATEEGIIEKFILSLPRHSDESVLI
ncbi:MAG: hypothetical protein KBB54_02190 [Candidatus Pacebacteria bacterium]|nr:hypothetical protein [Candidatus Paceibacterota bacterium]MBP9818701.1 hypothetical protein [Candidatus Paceibacterota bacterium]